MQKLLIIRGNSGCGKSTVAQKLREEAEGRVALIGQDTLRRTILMERDSLENTDILGLLEQTVMYCLKQEYTVILEGIFQKQKYKDTIVKMMNLASCESHLFYIDISIEESAKRHKTKQLSSEVSEEQLRSWYQHQDYLGVTGEVVIDEQSTLEETATLIKGYL